MCNPLSTHKPPWETRRIDAGKVGKEEADLKDEFRMKALIIKKLMPRSKKKKKEKKTRHSKASESLGLRSNIRDPPSLKAALRLRGSKRLGLMNAENLLCLSQTSTLHKAMSCIFKVM